MIPYSKEELYRRAWKQKIENTQTNYMPLKEELLRLLDAPMDPNYFNTFLKHRKTLLSTDHGQKFYWTPRFEFLWRILSIFGVKPRKGSRLREALRSEPEITHFPEYNVNQFPLIDKAETMDDAAFQDALFQRPLEALGFVETMLEEFETDFSNKASKKWIDPDKLASWFERLQAVRFHMDPISYAQLLQRICKIAPKYCLTYLYEHQGDSYRSVISEHESIEFHVMAQILMDHGVVHTNVPSANEIQLRCKNIINILLLLSASPKPPIDAFIKNVKTAIPGTPLIQLIDNLFEDPSNHQLKDTRVQFLTQSTSQLAPDESATANPLTLYFFNLALSRLNFDYRTNALGVKLSPQSDIRSTPRESFNSCWNKDVDDKKMGLAYKIISYIDKIYGSSEREYGHIEAELTATHEHVFNFVQTSTPINTNTSVPYKQLENHCLNLIERIQKAEGLKTTLGQIPFDFELPEDQIDWLLYRLGSYFPEETINELDAAFRGSEYVEETGVKKHPQHKNMAETHAISSGYGSLYGAKKKTNTKTASQIIDEGEDTAPSDSNLTPK